MSESATGSIIWAFSTFLLYFATLLSQATS